MLIQLTVNMYETFLHVLGKLFFQGFSFRIKTSKFPDTKETPDRN